ncbi:uncharacterized protein LOC144042684 isoform X2 [Vanacampus margaritifer]
MTCINFPMAAATLSLFSAFFLTAFVYASADESCQKSVVTRQEFQKKGFQFPALVDGCRIYISQNQMSIAYADLSAPTFTTSEEVVRMDNNSITTKHFRDTEIKWKCYNGSVVTHEDCMHYETKEWPDESEPMNITRDPDPSFHDASTKVGNHTMVTTVRKPSSKRCCNRNGLICAVGLFILVILVFCLTKIMRAHNEAASFKRSGEAHNGHICEKVQLQQMLLQAAGQNVV